MRRLFAHLSKHPLTVSLRFCILSVFSLLFLILLSVLVSIFYYHVSAVVERATFLLMSEASYAALNEFILELAPIQALTIFSTKNIRQDIFDVEQQDKVIPYMVHLLKETPLAEGAYWVDVNGSFIFVRKAPNQEFTAQIINRNHVPVTNTIQQLSNMHELLSSQTSTVDYDPRNEPWFILAAKKKREVWTPFYLKNHIFSGLTVSAPAIDDAGKLLGVFGIQVSIDSLSTYVSKQKITTHSEFYILDDDGKVIAASDPSKNFLNISETNSHSAKAFNAFQQTHNTNFKINDQGLNYLVYYKPIAMLRDSGWMIAIIVPEVDFVKRIHYLESLYLLIYLLIFLCGLLVMSSLVKRITNPINSLVDETKRIKNFHLDETHARTSRIREVGEISHAIEDMKAGLRSFKRYLPASLVRQLIRSGEGVSISSAKKDLVIFFSDIASFTSIAENDYANHLTQQIGDYFEALSRIIIRNNGTIDKYIGDSVMAFWGAPLPVEKPCQHAARTALRIQTKLNRQNALWQQEGYSPFKTRIGIHFGEVIVGNIGSSERLNYTVLGDNVNIASRLVDANKIYKTSILVSDTVYEQIKDEFVLRLVDLVTVKGKTAITAIYELLAQDSSELSFDLAQYKSAFGHAFSAYTEGNFQQASQAFEVCLTIYPQDKLAPIFMKRCKLLQVKPREHWDGIWHLH